MSFTPTELNRVDDNTLHIRWDDGTTMEYRVRELRDSCPCATCREKHGTPAPSDAFTILSPEETRPLRIAGMRPVGNYAYNIQFSDGHDTGIFTFAALRDLGHPVT